MDNEQNAKLTAAEDAKRPVGRRVIREIVAAKIGSFITNNLDDIRSAAESGTNIRLLSRDEMKFMSACDLGRNWDNLASAPTLAVEYNDGSFGAV